MANQKISQLSNAAALTGTEQVPIVQSGVTVKTPIQDIANLAIPYKLYSATVTQTSTNPPVSNVLYNNTGLTFTWSYISNGAYLLTLSSAIDITKTQVITPNSVVALMGYAIIEVGVKFTSNTELTVYNTQFGMAANDVLTDHTLQILIYP